MNIYEKLRSIPWFELDIPVDIEAIRNEYDLVSSKYEFKNYQTNYKLVRNYYAKSWSGIGLISSDGGLYTDLYEGDTVSNPDRFKHTEISSICPTMIRLANQLNGSEYKSRFRIMRIAPRRSLLWHSHVLEHGQPENIITIQVPIYMPEEFYYHSIDSSEFRWYKRFFKPTSFKSNQQTKLKPGKAYFFNSYHHHNVYNKSDEVRSTLMLYLDITKKEVYDLVIRSLRKSNLI